MYKRTTRKNGKRNNEEAIEDIKNGKIIIVVDDEDREAEGDFICAAECITPEMVNFVLKEARGVLCTALTQERCDEIGLDLMVGKNTDPKQTAFTVTVDLLGHGCTTGVSTHDRAATIKALTDPTMKPEDFGRPGHINPLKAREGGVLRRAGHTEAAVDLSRLAGLYPAGVICEIQNPDGSMARLPELIEYAKYHDLKIISIADLISYRLRYDRIIHRETVADLPTEFGNFKIYAYRHTLDNKEHVAIVKGDPEKFVDKPVMVRMHSECLTGDALGSLRCDCRMQLKAALKMINNSGEGVVVYLRQEGRGIGLINKLKAYSLQDMGLDTVEANERLGFPADLRDYGMGAQMLMDLNVHNIRLITNNPRKIAGLKGYGLEVVDRVPLLIEANDYNTHYLATKAKKLGHMLLQTYLVTLALHWDDEPLSITERYERLEKIRNLAKNHHLLLQEETRPLGLALFSEPSLAIHLGLDQANVASEDWYRDNDHPYVQAVTNILDKVAELPYVKKLEFLVSPGVDPLSKLQVKLDREALELSQLPSSLSGELETQKIYSFGK
ncbi:MAG: bifunctional 3,4-dihydroxy-2-butanone-4-phosphate synthase/GTP cyclohydrolase II [Rivularia sp. ALOHA_DT_140]|nr:bifunctional 3,4-dihydroxy-2-butanone-4-phosphate synthase/GTP cyclohydrolase II [Rivularia sp. ALOHA_DT_140]